ncbi:hypothetical protein E0371_07680, partial [Campylobacter coli]|nr:hypothetical protein [Campylobacter coli]
MIIVEVNIMDVTMSVCYKNLDFKMVKYINYLYEQLYLLKKKILILLLFDLCCINDNKNQSANFIMQWHKQLASFYDFNLIDFHQRMIDTNCFKFSERKLNLQINTIFKVLNPFDLVPHPSLKYIKDLIYNDKYVEISDKDLISFLKQYIGYKILGAHTFLPLKKRVLPTWQSMCENHFSMIFKNSKKEIVKSFRSYNNFDWLYDDFIIDSNTIVMYNKDNLPLTEISYETAMVDNLPNTSHRACIVNFLLIKNDLNFIQVKNNFCNIDHEKDFSYLIPHINTYRDIIEEYMLKTNNTIKMSLLK